MSILFISSCKEELLQPKEEESKSKVTDAKVIGGTFLESKIEDGELARKTRLEKFKKEHAKPHALLKKPEETLKELLENRKTKKAVVSSFKNNGIKTLQTGECDLLETEVWAFEKYQPISGKVIGISPKPAWQTDEGVLQILRASFGFRRVYVAEDYLIHPRNAFFPASEIAIAISEIAYFEDIMNLHDTTQFKKLFYKRTH